MPGASPVLSKSSWLLLRYSGAVFAGAPSILARSVSGTWSIYHGWCHSNGHSISNPTLAMVADSCVTYGTPEALVCPPCGVYRSVLSAVFRFHLPSLSSDQVLRMLLRSFQLSSVECVLRPHTWDLSMVLPI